MRFTVVGFLLASFACLSSCATVEPKMEKYVADDAGFLVIGLGSYTSAISKAITYSIVLRKTGESSVDRLAFTPHKLLVPFVGTKTDFETDDAVGYVEVRKLSPGNYELFRIEGNMYGILEWRWKSAESFSIPFTIKSKSATYIGDFRGIARSKRSVLSLGAPLPTGVYFVVSSQSVRDLAIARAKEPAITTMESSIPNVNELMSNYFSLKCDPDDCDQADQ